MASYHIIGDKDTVLGFRFAGATYDVVENVEQARTAFLNITEKHQDAVLLLTEAVEDMLTKEVTAHKLSSKPPFIAVVEDIWGNHGKRNSLQDLIYEAVGIRIVEEK
ncbi:MAG: V-type ATP synthase subunit F [Lentisphaeria bacterium]